MSMTIVDRKDTKLPYIFETHAFLVGARIIAKIPEAVSKQLPSRGQVLVEGTINGQDARVVLEPDGNWGHWIAFDTPLTSVLGIGPGDTVFFSVGVGKDWPDPEIPKDFARALSKAPTHVHDVWEKITPMARWEWVRWINATNNPETRMRRIVGSIDKLLLGKRRPCCFNLAACTDPELSKSGRLIAILDTV